MDKPPKGKRLLADSTTSTTTRKRAASAVAGKAPQELNVEGRFDQGVIIMLQSIDTSSNC